MYVYYNSCWLQFILLKNVIFINHFIFLLEGHYLKSCLGHQQNLGKPCLLACVMLWIMPVFVCKASHLYCSRFFNHSVTTNRFHRVGKPNKFVADWTHPFLIIKREIRQWGLNCICFLCRRRRTRHCCKRRCRVSGRTTCGCKKSPRAPWHVSSKSQSYSAMSTSPANRDGSSMAARPTFK